MIGVPDDAGASGRWRWSSRSRRARARPRTAIAHVQDFADKGFDLEATPCPIECTSSKRSPRPASARSTRRSSAPSSPRVSPDHGIERLHGPHRAGTARSRTRALADAARAEASERTLGAAHGERQALLCRVGERARPLARRDRRPGRARRAQRGRDDHRALGAAAPAPDPGRAARRAARFRVAAARGLPFAGTLLENGWLPTPRVRLPFPSIVAASTNDPLARYERVASLAAAWGSRLVNVGAVGHLNPAAGLRAVATGRGVRGRALAR